LFWIWFSVMLADPVASIPCSALKETKFLETRPAVVAIPTRLPVDRLPRIVPFEKIPT